MTDDITFCGSDCKNYECFRHPSNIQEPRIPHSFAYLKGTEDCPMKKQEVRLIDANALKENMKSRLSACNDWIEKAKDKETKIRASAVKTFIAEVILTIDNAPTVEIPIARWDCYCEGQKVGYKKALSERPKGEWINTSPYDDKGECSLCCYLSNKYYNFCPNCGAKMKGGAE